MYLTTSFPVVASAVNPPVALALRSTEKPVSLVLLSTQSTCIWLDDMAVAVNAVGATRAADAALAAAAGQAKDTSAPTTNAATLIDRDFVICLLLPRGRCRFGFARRWAHEICVPATDDCPCVELKLASGDPLVVTIMTE